MRALNQIVRSSFEIASLVAFGALVVAPRCVMMAVSALRSPTGFAGRNVMSSQDDCLVDDYGFASVVEVAEIPVAGRVICERPIQPRLVAA